MECKPLPYGEELPLIAFVNHICTVTPSNTVFPKSFLMLSSFLAFRFHSDLFSALRVSGLKPSYIVFLKPCKQHFGRLDYSSLRSEFKTLRSNVQGCLAVRLPRCCRYCTLFRTDYAVTHSLARDSTLSGRNIRQFRRFRVLLPECVVGSS